jgi:preprotein translocase subunit YajC
LLLIPLQAEPVETFSVFQMLLPFIVVLPIFYFMLIRPQQQQQKRRKEMIESVKKGDKVVTIGGIHGEIAAVDDDYFSLKIADNVQIKVNRGAVGQKLS